MGSSVYGLDCGCILLRMSISQGKDLSFPQIRDIVFVASLECPVKIPEGAVDMPSVFSTGKCQEGESPPACVSSFSKLSR